MRLPACMPCLVGLPPCRWCVAVPLVPIDDPACVKVRNSTSGSLYSATTETSHVLRGITTPTGALRLQLVKHCCEGLTFDHHKSTVTVELSWHDDCSASTSNSIPLP